jgi:glucose-6-phosphate isomerase
MSLPKIDPTKTESWKQLQHHFHDHRDVHLQQLFADDPSRAQTYAISWDDFYVDFSKNRITAQTFSTLLQLADEVGLKEAIHAQFSGQHINETEDRSVLHTALRDFDAMPQEVSETLQRMKSFSEQLNSGTWKGHSGKSITDVVNIGIGGSDLGPDMVCEALRYYKTALNVHFVSNVDGDHVMETIKDLDPERTLFIIVSKTFTTQETLTNAQTIRKWFLTKAPDSGISRHFVAVSTNLKSVEEFGIASENIFPMWDWVGGRFSLWSAVGLSIACAVGYDHFEQLLKGAHKMDKHFRATEFKENIPVVLALLSVWYNNFFEAESECIVPYSQYLSKLVAYLQQGIMESNGKSIDRNGNSVSYQTGTIVWGSTGTNAQHAFFQLIHQGTKIIPADFICFTESLYGNADHQNKLIANCLAQTEALMQGTYGSEVDNSFKKFDGNKPTNTILIKKLSPENLGSLIAMYEHKLFVQGVIWNIFSYDQWGVELGKKLAKNTLAAIKNKTPEKAANTSTKSLLERLS